MFSRNRSDYNHILTHIETNRASIFFGSEKEQDLIQFSHKIAENAERFEYWSKNLLIGLVACYFNDKDTLTGYITVASVASGFRNTGVGSELLKTTLQYGLDNGFKSVKLEVNVQNQKAIAFYKKFDFIIEKQNGDSFIMANTLIKN